MGDRARAHMIAWPFPANAASLPDELLTELEDFQIEEDTLTYPTDEPFFRYDSCGGVYQHSDGTRVLVLTYQEADGGTCIFDRIRGHLLDRGMNVMEENDAGGNYGASRDFKLAEERTWRAFTVEEHSGAEVASIDDIVQQAAAAIGLTPSEALRTHRDLTQIPDEILAATVRQVLNVPRLPAAARAAVDL